MAGTGKIKVSFREQPPEHRSKDHYAYKSFFKSNWVFDDIEEAVDQMMGILSTTKPDHILSLEMALDDDSLFGISICEE